MGKWFTQAFFKSVELFVYVKNGEIAHKSPDFWFLSENWKNLSPSAFHSHTAVTGCNKAVALHWTGVGSAVHRTPFLSLRAPQHGPSVRCHLSLYLHHCFLNITKNKETKEAERTCVSKREGGAQAYLCGIEDSPVCYTQIFGSLGSCLLPEHCGSWEPLKIFE